MAQFTLPNGCVVRSGKLSSYDELQVYAALDSKPITVGPRQNQTGSQRQQQEEQPQPSRLPSRP